MAGLLPVRAALIVPAGGPPLVVNWLEAVLQPRRELL